ncbi:MAG: DUF6515 family protein [Verrucomicrobiia bacterium]
MNLATTASRRTIGIGLLALLAAAPLGYAQRQEPRGAEAPRVSEPPRETSRPAAQRQPVAVDRTNHGSIRHVDTHVVQQPVGVQRGVDVPRGGIDQHQHVVPHHDVDVDIGRPQFWHGFVFGARIHGLRPGYVQLYVNGAPYFYDDGIYYQQAGDDYQEVYPPVGADVQDLPDGAIEIDAGNIAYYYAGGAFYVQQDGGYVIAPPPIGVTVPELPPGAVQVSYNGGVAYQFNGVYYQPEFVDGVTQYVTFQP